MATVTLQLPDAVAAQIDARARDAAFAGTADYLESIVGELFAEDDGRVSAAAHDALRRGLASPDSDKSPEEVLAELMREA
jgi:Arc/MetJ-type ribon-helix-helix transcriptional regulator